VAALALPSPARGLDWQNTGSVVTVPSGQTLQPDGSGGEITATSVDDAGVTVADGSRFVELRQNEATAPGAPLSDDRTRLYCDDDAVATGFDACFLHDYGGSAERVLTDDLTDGVLLEQLSSAPGDPPGTAYTALYALTDDTLRFHPEGGTEVVLGAPTYLAFNAGLSCGSYGTGYLGLNCDDTRTDVEITLQHDATLTYCKFHYAGDDATCDLTWTVMDGASTTACSASTSGEGSASDTASHAYSAGDTISVQFVEDTNNCATNMLIGAVLVLE